MFLLLFLLSLLCACYVIFIERKNYGTAWAWIMTILFLPVIGTLLYLFVGRPLHVRKTFVRKEEEGRFIQLLQSRLCPLPDDSTPYHPLINLHLSGHETPYTSCNTIRVFTDGTALFKDLYEAISCATRSIHLEYYIIRYDTLGLRLKELLIQKAKEGVEVCLVYDNMGCLFVPHRYFKELKASGVKLATFFKPFIPFLNLRFNYRNHRKICVIDEQIGYLGGFNIGNEYIGLDPKMGYWRDTHLRITGSSIYFLDLQFLLDWRFANKSTHSLDAYIDSYNKEPPTPTSSPLGMQLVASGPDSKYPAIKNGYIKLISEAKHTIRIQTPYFIPDDALLTALKLAALSGVSVQIMIPNKPDHLLVYWATYSYVGALLPYGIRCYTYESGFLHAKTIMIDGTMSSVGTANFDVRSLQLNFEINAFIYDNTIATSLEVIFDEDLEHCHELTLEHYTKRSYLIKTKEAIARLLSPIL
ncbi:MAG: cardiolipin synthase [Cellulosilyticaceae bacterium]